MFASFGQPPATLRPSPSPSFWLPVPVHFCCYFPEDRCPAHASQATQALPLNHANVNLSCFGPCLPVGSALARPENSRVTSGFTHDCYRLATFGLAVSTSYLEASHTVVWNSLRRVARAFICLIWPTTGFVTASAVFSFWLHVPVLFFCKSAATSPRSVVPLTRYSSVVSASSERCVNVIWPVPTRW